MRRRRFGLWVGTASLKHVPKIEHVPKKREPLLLAETMLANSMQSAFDSELAERSLSHVR
jgi:hypothetical protein